MANIILPEDKMAERWVWQLVGDPAAAVEEVGLGLNAGQTGIEELVKQRDQDFLWKYIWFYWKCGTLTVQLRPSETHREGFLEDKKRPLGCFQTFLEGERPLGCFPHLHLRSHTCQRVFPCKRWHEFSVWFALYEELIFHFLPVQKIFVSKHFFEKIKLWNSKHCQRHNGPRVLPL